MPLGVCVADDNGAMRISDLLQTGRPSISFEFFPPKDAAGLAHLDRALAALRELNPTFVSVTCSPGGQMRQRTLELTVRLRDEFGFTPMAHVTCVGASRQDLRNTLGRLRDAGIENVLALRGDLPPEQGAFHPPPDGLAHASDLVALARQEFDFCIAGACYPEKHIEAPSFDVDLANLRRKVDAGCSFLITQLFFDNQKYFDFVARTRAVGIDVPIIPGIMPITNVRQIERFTKVCGATIPEPLYSELWRLQDDPHAVLALGVAHATAQCVELLQCGAPGLHFYTLNRSPATRTILMAIRTIYPPAAEPAGQPPEVADGRSTGGAPPPPRA